MYIYIYDIYMIDIYIYIFDIYIYIYMIYWDSTTMAYMWVLEDTSKDV